MIADRPRHAVEVTSRPPVVSALLCRLKDLLFCRGARQAAVSQLQNGLVLGFGSTPYGDGGALAPLVIKRIERAA
jgi:hypothetical protein